MSRPRYRILFAKTEAMRYTGNLDLQRAWERLLRRARVPVAYSAGFHPHPKIQIGAALPLGVTGEKELVDIETGEPCDADDTAARLNDHAPPGIRVLKITTLAEGSRGLEKLITAGEYSAVPLEGAWPEDLPRRIDRLLDGAALPRERRGKTYDLRPRILFLSLEGRTLRMRLSLLPAATGRPDEVLAALGLEDVAAVIKRERLVLRETDGVKTAIDHGPSTTGKPSGTEEKTTTG
jgi:radical SAM-linked protein